MPEIEPGVQPVI